MRRHLFIFLLLTTVIIVKAQRAYTYRYWFDNNHAAVHTGSGTGEILLDIDASSLSFHQIHALRVQAKIDGEWSSVVSRFFLRTGTPEVASARYWLDNDYSTAKTAPTLRGSFELDLTGLKTGMHSVHYQTHGADGSVSPVHTQYFLYTDYEGELMTCVFWFDDDEENTQTYAYTNQDIVLNTSSLDYGSHQLTALLYDGAGILVARETVNFVFEFSGDVITLGKAQTTYCSDKPLDFGSVSGIKAYVASGFNPETGILLLMRVNEVPANTGLLLKGTAGSTYNIPYKETSFYYLNMFKGVLSRTNVPTTSEGYKNYILKDGIFHLSDGTAYVGANKAYLQMPILSAQTRSVIGLSFDDETTDINESIIEETNKENNLYNLNGQKINTPKKGIYIRNGQKVIIH